MKGSKRHLRSVLTSILFVSALAAWLTLAPTRIGGQASYVVVNGNSMEPRFHTGDLVIVREADSYQVGNVATYRHPDLGPVIHRIVARDGRRFVFKGDNNSWLDSHQPEQSELVGKLWIHAPGGGKVVNLLRTPSGVALFAGGIGMIALAPLLRKRPERKRPARRSGAQSTASSVNLLSESGQGILNVLATVAIVSLVLAAFAFTRPTSRAVSEDVTYQQSGEFSYSASAPSGVYDTGSAVTGEPVFRRLSSRVTTGFKYRFTSEHPGQVSGTYRLVAELSEVNGWKRTLELQPSTPFRGDELTARGVLDLPRVQSLLDGIEKQTGFERDSYTLAVVPEVKVQGALAGQPLQDGFSPRLVFRLDPLQLQLAGDGATDTDPLKPSKPGLLKLSSTAPNTLPLLRFHLDVSTARLLSLLGLALSLGGLAWLGALTLRVLGDEPSAIQARYGRLLIPVRGPVATGDRVVEVDGFDELVKLAARFGGPILHETDGDADRYYVQEAGLTLRYEPAHAEAADLSGVAEAAAR